jgi:hypothetical protein
MLPRSDPAVGHSTQIAIFEDLQPDCKSALDDFGELCLVEHIEFPYFNEPEKTLAEILDEINGFMKYLVEPRKKSDISETFAQRIKVDQLWGFHRLRLICKTQERLREVLATSTDFTLVNDDEFLAHKEYENDLSYYEEETYCEPYTNDTTADYDEEMSSPSAWESVQWIEWRQDDIGWGLVRDEVENGARSEWGST